MIVEMKENPRASSLYDSLSLWLFAYSCCYAFFHIIPSFLNYEIQNLFMIADLVDLCTPFIMVFLVYKIYRSLRQTHLERFNTPVQTHVILILILGSITFVEGHGMHLAANAIARHLTPNSNPSLFALDYFFDEILSHIFWDSGIILISVGIILMGINLAKTYTLRPRSISILFASILYGFTYFVNAVEGQTVVFTLPVAIVLPVIIVCLSYRKDLRLLKNPVLFMFFVGYLFSVCLFLIWGIWNKGYPQFSERGWI